ncbi:hypothetical protein INT48_001438 [Thamnidium elegans]|uniref:Uncharacterized protein n=1 Tax=Thamnidium elegans TaxID=101142 RepID=A0A8H7VYK7_9FUNG|nr:hypothetical protein INT48_001438 [Thamnidium elegans]
MVLLEELYPFLILKPSIKSPLQPYNEEIIKAFGCGSVADFAKEVKLFKANHKQVNAAKFISKIGQGRHDVKLVNTSYNADGCHTSTVAGKCIELSVVEVSGSINETNCVMHLIFTAVIPTEYDDSESKMRDLFGLNLTLENVEKLHKEHQAVELAIARETTDRATAAATSIPTSFEKGSILKIKGEYIPGYEELEVHSTFIMFSIAGKIMFENVQRDIVDENGNEAMGWEEEVNPHNTETLSNLTQYSGKQS